MIEVEAYRRVAERAVGRTIATVDAPDAWILKRGTTAAALQDAIVGRAVERTDRVGKVLLLDLEGGPTVGLRFGMTGRLVVDEHGPIEKLEYGSKRDLPQWNRFGLRFADGGSLRLSDPRRLGGVELEPDTSRLGPDALAITPTGLRDALAGGTGPVKARLLDQSRVAGLGNLLVDETLWRAGLDPARPAGSLDGPELRRLHRQMRRTIDVLIARGGSHTGDLQGERQRGGHCPRDGAELARRTIGGRTTYSCPVHQR